MRRLIPSEIRYSQDSISNHFDSKSRHGNVRIGKTLDDLIEVYISVADIPTITVIKKHETWFTADNRRLWVFQHLEIVGKCDTIPVKETTHIPWTKMTTNNNGTSVRVRGSVGGKYYPLTEAFVKLKAEKETAEANRNHLVAQLSDSKASQQRIERAYKKQLAENEMIKQQIKDLESKIRKLESLDTQSVMRQNRPIYHRRETSLETKSLRPLSELKMPTDYEYHERSLKSLDAEKEANKRLTSEIQTLKWIMNYKLSRIKRENNILKIENNHLKESTKMLEKQLSDIRN